MTRAWSCTQEVIARLTTRSRRKCDPPVVTFHLSLSSPSCRDGPAIVVVTITTSCSNHRRHRPVVMIMLSSSSPSCRCNHAIIVLTTHVIVIIVVVIAILASRFWRHVSLLPSCLSLLLSSWRASWHCLSIVVQTSSCRRRRPVRHLWRHRPFADHALRYHSARNKWS